MNEMNKYIEFRNLRYTATGKTLIIDVASRTRDSFLGQIKWFARWRQYAFFPSNDTVFNTECMDYISDYITSLMAHRKSR